MKGVLPKGGFVQEDDLQQRTFCGRTFCGRIFVGRCFGQEDVMRREVLYQHRPQGLKLSILYHCLFFVVQQVYQNLTLFTMSTNVYQVYQGVYTNTNIYLLRAHNDRQTTSLIIQSIENRLGYIYLYKCGSNPNEYQYCIVINGGNRGVSNIVYNVYQGLSCRLLLTALYLSTIISVIISVYLL